MIIDRPSSIELWMNNNVRNWSRVQHNAPPPPNAPDDIRKRSIEKKNAIKGHRGEREREKEEGSKNREEENARRRRGAGDIAGQNTMP